MLETNKIYCIDCLEGMKKLPDESVDSIVTDPPYGLKFMGHKWDYDVPKTEVWRECLRVLKAGGHIVVACGTRTQHKMAQNIEEAGFEIRDIIAWVYGSGFPKSLDISKAIDKKLGFEREVIGKGISGDVSTHKTHAMGLQAEKGTNTFGGEYDITAPASEQAKEWSGWGTALKPSIELWTLARKPLKQKTVAEQILITGTGGINIGACRIDYEGETPNIGGRANHGRGEGYGFKALGEEIKANTEGRFPANLIHDGSKEVKSLFPESDGAGNSLPQVKVTGYGDKIGTGSYEYIGGERTPFNCGTGSASRFFKECTYTELDNYKPIIYCPKASSSERELGCENLQTKEENLQGLDTRGRTLIREDGTKTLVERRKGTPRTNNHPTVKPVELMRYLCRLITPPKGLCVDPYEGSGTTAVACRLESLQFIGFEISKEYCDIAEARIKEYMKQKKLFEVI